MGMRVKRISVGRRGIWVENVVNQDGDAGNQNRNLNIAVEITWNSNGNDELKDWREVQIINLVSRLTWCLSC